MNELGVPQAMTAQRASFILCICLDLIAFASLAATSEIHPGAFGAALACILIATLLGRKRKGELKGGVLVLLYVALVFLSGLAWRSTHLPPVVIAGHAAPIAHALIWFAADSPRNRSWRLGMGFLELIIASALTPEFYLPFAIIAFVVIGSVALSCGFLESELAHAGEGGSNALPRAYIRNGIVHSFGIFLTSAIIFPILPRTHIGGGLSGQAQTGYTEEVRINELTSFSASQSSQVMMRLWTEPSSEFLTSIYLGLLRGRVLDAFDGDRWLPSRASNVVLPLSSRTDDDPKATYLEASKEILHSPILPTPYGTSSAWIMPSDGESLVAARQSRGHQWVDFPSAYSRARYRIHLSENQIYRKPEKSEVGEAARDLPLPLHSAIPPAYDTDRMKRFSATLFAGAVKPGEKISRIREWFFKQQFAAVAAGNAGDVNANELAIRLNQSRLTPLENFLFVTKQGHCELFASSGALLLRHGGVPTRLIAGFRISKGPTGGILSVRSNDAHAWFEAWIEGRGWMPIDITPRVLMPSRFIEVFRDAYELLGAYWSRYVVGYSGRDDSGDTGKDNRWSRMTKTIGDIFDVKSGISKIAQASPLFWLTLIATLAALVGLTFLALRAWNPAYFSIEWRVREGSRELRSERLRMEKLVRRHVKTSLSREARQALTEWTACYQAARFGRSATSQSSETLADHRKRFLKFARAA